MNKILAVMIATALGLASAGATAGKLQCWTDENGARACGDRVPPQYAKKEREVLNSQGVVVGKEARQKTEVEVAEEKLKVEADVAEKKRFEEQTAYDKYMLQTFDSVTQMQAVRDTRIVTLDGRLKLAEKSVGGAETSLKELKDRAAALEKSGRPVDPKLTKQITDFEASLVNTLKSIAQMKKERGEIALKFDADAERFRKLRAGEIRTGSAAQAEASTQ